MGTKAEYKSAAHSRALILQAFAALMAEKDLEKITVTDIIAKADISRATFYAHYKNPRAVITQIENDIIEKMMILLGEFRSKKFFRDPMPLLLEVSRYIHKDENIYRKIINAKGSAEFLDKLKNIFITYMKNESDIPDQLKSASDFNIRANFFAGGIVNVYQNWFSVNTECSLNEIASVVSKIIKEIKSPIM